MNRHSSGSTAIPRIIITGPRGGSGKTLLSLGLARALSTRGTKVAPFKKGPDYIDARWLEGACGSPCHNLDPFLMSKEKIRWSVTTYGGDSELALIEGNRGLHDGLDEEGSASTAQLAKWLRAPVILVLDCTKMTRTAAALVFGLKMLDREVDLRAVILNRLGGRRHEKIVRSTIERYCGIPVLGALPRLSEDPLPMRHLGVTPMEEYPETERALDKLARLVEERVDVEGLVSIAGSAPQLEAHSSYPFSTLSDGKGIRIGVARDKAFQFYYPENLEALEATGAEVVLLSPCHDRDLHGVDGLYIGGGFPETQAELLEGNASFRKAVRRAALAGMPVYAECGGLMYLGQAIHWRGRTHAMTGLLPWEFIVEKRPVGHGYSVLEALEETPFHRRGEVIRGHEFHYSRPVPSGDNQDCRLAFKVLRGKGIEGGRGGITCGKVFATYTHTHALSHPEWAPRLIRAALRWRDSR